MKHSYKIYIKLSIESRSKFKDILYLSSKSKNNFNVRPIFIRMYSYYNNSMRVSRTYVLHKV